MSVKRQATTQLNHENWDQDDPTEHEEMGNFKPASKEILEKRVIKKAARRSQLSSDEPKKSVFSGFGGFNKTQTPSSFDFLANLTNGNKNTNGSPNNSDTSVNSSLFTSIASSNNPVSSVFGHQATSTPTKTTFGPPSQKSNLFGGKTANTGASSTLFSSTKADSIVSDSALKTQSISGKAADTPLNASPSQMSSNLFGISSASTDTSKAVFSTKTNSPPFKVQPVSTTISTVQTSFTIKTQASNEEKTSTEKDEKKIKYYSKLQGLNQSVSDWIRKHVELSPLCILSPIFKDYEKHLKDIQSEYYGTDIINEAKDKCKVETQAQESKSTPKSDTTNVSIFKGNSAENPLYKTDTSKPFFSTQDTTTSNEKLSNFSFENNMSTNVTSSATTSITTSTTTGFKFGITSTVAGSTSAPLSFSTNTTTNSGATPFSFSTNITTSTTNATAPFSFGIGKPFSFNSNIQKPVEQSNTNNEDEDEPPKVEFTPVVEENSVYDKKCKIFVKKDGNFVDKGVGTLYIKQIKENGKHQLLVRANTNLGNVMLNTILASAIPTQRMGKNNVMIVCIPTPEAKPPPTPILIRVKTSEEADELLDTLKKYMT